MQTALIIIGSIIAGFLLLNVYARIKMKNLPKVSDHANILTLTDKNFDQQTKNKVVLVDFWAEWCAPCKMMAPVLNDVADELSGNSHVGKLNIEQYQSMAQRFNVRSIPTLILFKNGKEVKRFVGIKQKDFLLKEIKSITI
jgi:thioredoxin 1